MQNMKIIVSKKENKSAGKIFLYSEIKSLRSKCTKEEYQFLKNESSSNDVVEFGNYDTRKVIISSKKKAIEFFRKTAANLNLQGDFDLLYLDVSKTKAIAFLEGALLNDYSFLKYKTDCNLDFVSINVISTEIKSTDLAQLENVIESVNSARDWVNEPVNQLTTDNYLSQIKQLSKTGVEVDIFRKSKLESLNMGGILGVNKGSNEEPALAKLEWKPKGYHNDKPIVLIGKGILFDTGGINIKTGNFMTDMKADMGGSATVVATIKAIARNKLPLHVIVLTPITENRINGNELVPGDVITMHNGKTVEVLNTDAEGRLVLADALSFAKKFNPELVIDVATLTGSAFRLTGHNGAVVMGTSDKNIHQLKKSSATTFERIIELPMWEEFEDTLKSNVADLNNLGSGEGQAVCAGFFLKNFVDYPWIHLDIAGPAFIPSDKDYHKKGGTGFGVRLLYQFLKDKFDLN